MQDILNALPLGIVVGTFVGGFAFAFIAGRASVGLFLQRDTSTLEFVEAMDRLEAKIYQENMNRKSATSSGSLN